MIFLRHFPKSDFLKTKSAGQRHADSGAKNYALNYRAQPHILNIFRLYNSKFMHNFKF